MVLHNIKNMQLTINYGYLFKYKDKDILCISDFDKCLCFSLKLHCTVNWFGQKQLFWGMGKKVL